MAKSAKLDFLWPDSIIRVAAAFADGATVDTVAALIQEAEAAALRLAMLPSRRCRGCASGLRKCRRPRRTIADVWPTRRPGPSATNWPQSSPGSTRRSPRSSLTCSGASAPAMIASST